MGQKKRGVINFIIIYNNFIRVYNSIIINFIILRFFVFDARIFADVSDIRNILPKALKEKAFPALKKLSSLFL